jgi:acyl carrier protein
MNAAKRQVLSDITDVIHAVSDHVPPAQKIGMDTMLVADLGLESIEVASLFFMLRKRYDGIVSVADLVLEVVETDAISDLKVGRIVDFISGK